MLMACSFFISVQSTIMELQEHSNARTPINEPAGRGASPGADVAGPGADVVNGHADKAPEHICSGRRQR